MIDPHNRENAVSHDAGITGVMRFRRQKFTGLQILQVEVLRQINIYRAGNLVRVTWGVNWKDATDIQAAQISLRTGFVTAGQNIVTIDEHGACFNEHGDKVAVRLPDRIVWCGGRLNTSDCQHQWQLPSFHGSLPLGQTVCRLCGLKAPSRKP